MKRFSVLFILLALHGVAANAVETNITILGVRFSGSNSTVAGSYMTTVAQYWPTSIGTTITLANGGVPLSIGTSLSGTDAQQMDQAKLIAYGLNLRNFYQADVIFFFTSTIVNEVGAGICGWAPQRNWTAAGGTPGVFNDPDGDGIDLAGSEHWYAAIMATIGPCTADSVLSLHEFGHLFGAGHEYTGGVHHYLYTDSHAYLYFLPWPYPTIRSNMHTSYFTGYNWFQYSDTLGVEDNVRALSRTALSVANYRPLYDTPPSPPPYPPPPLGGCSLQTPAYMTQQLRGHCDPPPYSKYFLTWGDACPSATSYYRMWVEQPVGTGYLPDATVGTPFTYAWVAGVPGRVRVQACNGGGCSALSPDNVLLLPGC